jgi:hypothetical protein
MNRAPICFLLALCTPFLASAQGEPAMADGLRAEGKIYVVVTILLVVLAGLLAYVILTDRKVTKLEEQIRNKSAKD